MRFLIALFGCLAIGMPWFSPTCSAQNQPGDVVGKTDATTRPTVDVLTLMDPADRKACGIDQLTKEQQDALNKWIAKTYLLILQTSAVQAQEKGEVQLFDSAGTPTAVLALEDGETIYLWSGKPVAYLDGDSIVGFNGKRIGWFQHGKVYDVDGGLIGATADQFTQPPTVTSLPGLRQFKPFKMFEELEPLKSIFLPTWAEHQLAQVLNQGAD